MCNFFPKCKRNCSTHNNHFIHWKHITDYYRDIKPSYQYKRLRTDNDDNDDNDIQDKKKQSPLINYQKYEEYLINALVYNILDNIIDNIIDKNME